MGTLRLQAATEPRGSFASARRASTLASVLFLVLLAAPALAQCPEKPSLQNFTGAGRVTCPCFVAGEKAGAVFTAPAADYPLEILRVGIGWGSATGGNPTLLEEAIHVYQGGLPNPGNPIFTLEGPLLNDGAINQFDLEPQPGEIAIESGPFTVALEFFNENAGNIFAPSVVHDNNGCQPGRNAVFAIPGGWNDACALGISGDWVFFVIYRPCLSSTGVGEPTKIASSSPLYLMARPNPSRGLTELEFVLAQPGHAALSVHDLSGRRVAQVADAPYESGVHRASWNGRTSAGADAPSGLYFVELRVGELRARRSVLITR